MRSLLAIGFTLLSFTLCAQNTNLPYKEIPSQPEAFSAGSVAARMVDGLGFRFYWATEGLREIDLKYKPSADARTSQETIEHIYEMSFIVLNAAIGKENVNGQDVKLPFAEMRKRTLENLSEASNHFRSLSDAEFSNLKLIFKGGTKSIELPLWNLLNGPMSDCIWHVGQVVSFRRSSGNP